MLDRARPLPRRALLGLLLATVTAATVIAPATVSGSGAVPTSSTSTPSSPTAHTVEGYLITWINHDRALRGLRPLFLWSSLRNVATNRANTLASLGILSHTAAGNLSSQLTAAGVSAYSWGEDIGWSSYPWGYDVARSLYTMWKNSSGHWALLMSSRYNYFGIGLAYRWSAHATYASIVFTESRDHTGARAAMVSHGRYGTTIWFTWRGYDPRLQTHTAGLRNFDVEYKVDSGAWRVIRWGTTSTSIRLYSRARRHTYWVRVRARDRNGNVGSFSTTQRVSIP